MSTAAELAWCDRNQACLVAGFAALRRRLGGDGQAGSTDGASATPASGSPAEPPVDPPSAIDTLAARFALSTFERDLLLLCAGMEMDPALAALCAQATGQSERSAVTFSLAMSVLDEPHWSALAPSRPLRRFRLIEMASGHGVTNAPLRIDERILHYLAGVNHLDERLDGLLRMKVPPPWIGDAQSRLAAATTCALPGEPDARALLLFGDDVAGQEAVAATIAQHAGAQLYVLRHADTPAAGADADQFIHLWMRESLLLPAYVLLQWRDERPSAAALQLAEGLPGGVMIASREPMRLSRPMTAVEVNRPDPAGQRQMWQTALGPLADALHGTVDQAAAQFRLSAEDIVAIASSLGAGAGAGARSVDAPRDAQLWDACRAAARHGVEGLAERIEPRAGWDDLILPALQKSMLRELAMQSRHRMTVYETWGFSARGRRGLGLSALFSGPSGTGKTLAAEVLAQDLALDLYRIDLSSVVSKYIGETEKNLKRVFDAAECGGMVLLFDEADALFGKRSEVKDSHDRYANIEVGYLLQRMESFLGLAILTTNLKSSLDKSFQRRLRFTIDFPFPDAIQREAIWSRVFPAGTPTRDLLPNRLAILNMAGGNIRNIALNAAFLAASHDEPVSMAHVLHATRMEAAKLDRTLSELETRGWV